MRLSQNALWASAILVLAIAVGTLMYAYAAKADAADLNQTNTVATTTVAYLAPGLATSTQTYDSYAGGVGDPNASDSAVLLLQFAASSTSSVLNINVQYSMNGIDWYGDNLGAATSSTGINLPNVYAWTAAGTATTSRAISIPTPVRFSRAVIGITGASGAVYGNIVVKKQQPSH